MIQQVNKSKELEVYETLNGRINFTQEQKAKIRNLQKGYEGEKRFSNQLNELTNQRYIPLFDILLEESGTVFQLDCLLIFPHEIILLEVKNYYGEFMLNEDYLYSLSHKKRYRNPLHQLQRSQLQLSEFFTKHNINMPLTSHVIFINQEFTLFHAEHSPKIILPTQLEAFLKKLNNKAGTIQQSHYNIAKSLLDQQFNYPLHNRLPEYCYSQLQKGILCKSCRIHLINENRKVYCARCGKEEQMEVAIMRNVHEYHLLFPEEKISIKKITDWCGDMISKSAIKRALIKNMNLKKNGRHSYYTFI